MSRERDYHNYYDLPEGATVRLKFMKGESENTMPEGLLGTYQGQDDAGHLLIKWENGSTLSILPSTDRFEVIQDPADLI